MLVPDTGQRAHGLQLLGVAPHLDVEISAVGEQQAGQNLDRRDGHETCAEYQGNACRELPRTPAGLFLWGSAASHRTAPSPHWQVPDWRSAYATMAAHRFMPAFPMCRGHSGVAMRAAAADSIPASGKFAVVIGARAHQACGSKRAAP